MTRAGGFRARVAAREMEVRTVPLRACIFVASRAVCAVRLHARGLEQSHGWHNRSASAVEVALSDVNTFV